MKPPFDIDTFRLFLLFVFPGAISIHVYKLLMPSKRVEWQTILLEGLFYSGVNFALLLPLISFIHTDGFPSKHPIWYQVLLIMVILLAPIIWPILYRKILRSEKLMAGLNLPIPTAWDFFFDRREEVFVLIHLLNGNLIGGFYGEGSYATSFPYEGDIYLKSVYEVDENGKFGAPIQESMGLLIRKDQYSYIEFFSIPKQEDIQDVE